MTPACEKIFTGGGQYGPPVLITTGNSNISVGDKFFCAFFLTHTEIL